LLALLSGCVQNDQSTLHPAGPGAARIADLWWLMLVAASVVFLLVCLVLYRALTHRGQRSEPRARSYDPGAIKLVLAGGVALPTLVLVPLLILTLYTLAWLAPPKSGSALEVVITGWQWWWDVQYTGGEPAGGLRTANEIRIPVGRPVRIQLRSGDVIHSFWVPALQGKLDLVPGQVNTTWLQADTAGVYRGECAEYCGLQHARMQFRVVALQPSEFDSWMKAQQAPAAAAADSTSRAGQSVFMSSGCAFCHAIRGTSARGTAGPDLTHLAGRLTLAAGTLPNTKGHLAGWIANPQGIKPGNLMPRIPLEPEELRVLLAYLGTLR
jgi:cytochrome c oxidase subunit 2